MTKSSLLPYLFFIMSLGIISCGSSPTARFYALNAIARNPRPPVAIIPLRTKVKLGPITIPDTLDQPKIVSRSGSNRVIMNEFNRWGGDFQSELLRILGENISILLPTEQVILSNDYATLPYEFQVIVNIRKFDGKLGGTVTLNADWIVIRQGKQKPIIAKKSILEEQTDAVDYQAYVETQSHLLARLSQEISNEIRKSQSERK